MSYYYLQTSNDHLAHHGILGMKWGIRRYQPYAKGSKGGKEIGLAAKKSKGGSLRERREERKTRKQQEKVLNKQKSLEAVKKNPKATDVLKYVDQLSTEDLVNLNRRIKVIRDLEVTSKLEKHRGFYAIDSVMNRIGKINNWWRTGETTYKTANDILSVLNGEYGK